MDAVGAHHHVCRDARTVGEDDGGLVIPLLETDALVPGMDDRGRQLVHEQAQQVGAMETVELDAGRLLLRPHGRGEGAVLAAELRVDPARAVARHAVARAQLAQHADAVGLHRHPGTHLGQGGRLLVEMHVDAALQQREGRGAAADAAANYGDAEWGGPHGRSHRLRLAFSITSPHSARSRSRNAAVSPGVWPMGVAPCFSKLDRISSVLSTATTSRLIFSTMASGVSGGATSPNHATDTKPGRA